MADIVMVKMGLRCCGHYDGDYCKECPYTDDDDDCTASLANGALTVIEELQAEVERLQPKKGHWEMKEDPFGFFEEIPVCSECGCTNGMRKKTAYCEHCGADMREGDGDENKRTDQE